MLKEMPKQEYLAQLQTRNQQNRQTVKSLFRPLSPAERSWQPAPGEWSVDQCFQHLIVAFENFAPNTTKALNTPEPAGTDGVFRPSWFIKKTLPFTFDPKIKLPTIRRFNPPTTSHPEAVTRLLAQQERLAAIIEQAAGADLHTKCWYFKPLRYSLGEFLYFFVAHDSLHIDQAQRVLEAYKQQQAAVSSG